MHRHLEHLSKIHRDLTKAMHRMEHDHKKEGAAMEKGKIKEMRKEHHREGREMHKVGHPMAHHRKEHHRKEEHHSKREHHRRKDCY